MAERTEREVVLVLADISGYTRYMVEHRTAALHSQDLITQLLEAVIAQVEIPLRVSKLEGDAVFLFAERDDAADWPAACRAIGARMEAFVRGFNARLAELVATNACPCPACRNLGRLRLKVLAHAGQAVRHHVGGFEELTGVDVILVHRLLKNPVRARSYLLLTGPAFSCLAPPSAEAYSDARLQDADLGTIPLRVRLLEPPAAGALEGLRRLVKAIRWRFLVRAGN